MLQPVRVRLLSSEKKSRMLTNSRAESSILAYQRKRVQSRTQRNRPLYHPTEKQIRASDFADIFQASQDIFRKSLAFTHAREITQRPHRSFVNGLFRSYLKRGDYERAKEQKVKHQRYVSSYNIPRRVESCRLQF